MSHLCSHLTADIVSVSIVYSCVSIVNLKHRMKDMTIST